MNLRLAHLLPPSMAVSAIILAFISSHFQAQKMLNQKSSHFPVYVWLMCGVVTPLINFFTVFGDFGLSFQNMCVMALALSHYNSMEKGDIENTALPV